MTARTTAPTRALEEVTDIAPFVEEAPTGEDVDEAEDALEEATELAVDVDEESDDGEEAALRALPTSGGTIMGVEPIEARLTEPSAFMISGFIANTLRVNMTFSTTASYAQEGMLLISMLAPQLAPAEPEVWLDVYEAYVARFPEVS